MLQDLRYALRQLRKSPGFAAVAILTLALGMAGSTVFFGALRALVLEPLTYPDSDRLVQLWSGPRWPLSCPDFLDIRDSNTSFVDLGAYSPQATNLGGERPRSVPAVVCTAGVLRAFAVPPLIGRGLEVADEQPGAAPVAVIAHALWRNTFAADPGIVGRTVLLDGTATTVIGVMPPAFEFAAPWMRGYDCQLWRPLPLDRAERERGSHWMCAVGRLKPGVTFGAAAAEVHAIGARLTSAHPETNTNKPFLLRTLRTEMTEDIGTDTWMLFAAVLLILLIACCNVASMLLARGALRQGELGLRTAIGASRLQLVRLVLCESLLIAIAGMVLGVLLADFASGPISTLIPAGEQRQAAAAPELHTLLFAAGLAGLSALLAGLPAAITGSRIGISEPLRSANGQATGSRARHRLLRTLIVSQIVVAFLLANGAALFAASYLAVKGANRDLSTEQVLSVELNLRGPRYADAAARASFSEQLVAASSALPGVAAAATTSKLPLHGGSNTSILTDDQIFDPAVERPLAEVSGITPGYFETAGIRLLRGRTLRAEDVGAQRIGVVVNRTLAERCWPGAEALGRTLRANEASSTWVATVVGVVEDVRQWGPTMPPQPEIYWTVDRAWNNTVFLLVRSSRPASGLAETLRRTISGLDPDLPLARTRTLEQLVLDATHGQRLVAWLVGLFTAVALALSAVGLYGTLSYLIRERTREIGIRLALGAEPAGVHRLVVGQGLRWVLFGAALGLAGSLALAGVLRSVLSGVAPIAPSALVAGLASVTIVGLLACWLPARRAAHVDPLVALRAE